jgi:hypothetical protein
MKKHARLLAVTFVGAASVAVAAAASDVLAAASSSRAAPVTYTARVFMRGMKVTVPNAGWKVHEDHPGEFNLASPAGRMSGTNIHFWLDPIAAAQHGLVVPDVGRTPPDLIRWLRRNPNFVVSAPKTRRIAGGLAAKSIDLDVAAIAPREDPGCTAACVTYFVFKGPHYAFPYGTGRGEPIRLFFALVGTGKAPHTFTVSIDTPSPTAFKAVIPIAQRILASVKLPNKISAG